jgi:hypothetical protein
LLLRRTGDCSAFTFLEFKSRVIERALVFPFNVCSEVTNLKGSGFYIALLHVLISFRSVIIFAPLSMFSPIIQGVSDRDLQL